MGVAVEVPETALVRISSGYLLDLLNPDPFLITPISIVRPLSRICRFGGHANRFYSVAQHSVHVCRLIGDRGGSEQAQFAGLLHDAAEAFIGDVWSPLKRVLGESYRTVEARIDAAIEERFGVDFKSHHAAVKEADQIMLAVEKRDLMLGAKPQPLAEGIAGIEPWSVDHSAAIFSSLLWQFVRR